MNTGKIALQKVPKKAKYDISKVCFETSALKLLSFLWWFNKNFSLGKIFLYFLQRWFTIWLLMCIFIMQGCCILFCARKHLIPIRTFNDKSFSHHCFNYIIQYSFQLSPPSPDTFYSSFYIWLELGPSLCREIMWKSLQKEK